jgi:hypothetical protein
MESKMNTFLRFRLSFAVIVGMTWGASVCHSANIYHVSEIIRVISPVSFECRLLDFPYARQVRFQVFLKDAVLDSARPEDEAVQALREAMASAKTIELREVNLRNYFRLDAQVWADGENVNAKLISGHYLRETVLIQSDKIEEPRVVVRSEVQRPTPLPVVVRRSKTDDYDLQALLKTKINLSSLHSETPLQEALQIISGSLEPRLPIVVFWSDLENNAYVDRDTPIGVEGFGWISAAQGLDAILYSVSGYGVPLKFTLKGGILKVGTVNSLSQKTTQVYSVADIVSPPADYTEDDNYGSGNTGSGNFMGMSGSRN